MSEPRGQISIWFFIGALLAAYGVLILGAGIAQALHPPRPGVVLQNLHAGIWWGGVLLAAGAWYTLHFRPRR